MYQKSVGCSKAKMHECLSDLHEADDEEGDRKSLVKGALAGVNDWGVLAGQAQKSKRAAGAFCWSSLS